MQFYLRKIHKKITESQNQTTTQREISSENVQYYGIELPRMRKLEGKDRKEKNENEMQPLFLTI